MDTEVHLLQNDATLHLTLLKSERASSVTVLCPRAYEAAFHYARAVKQFQPTKRLRAESGAGARRRPLLGLTIPAYETHCWKW
jgi:hypothetical protein